MHSNLFSAIRSLGLHGYEVAQKIGMDQGAFSKALNGRREFNATQKEQLARLTGQPTSVLFSTTPGATMRAGRPLPELFRDLDGALATDGADLVWLLEKIHTSEPRESYLAAVAHLVGILRHRHQVPAGQFRHYLFEYREAPQFPHGYFFPTAQPAQRAGEDTIQRQGNSLIHPIRNGGTWPPPRENTMLKMECEKR